MSYVPLFNEDDISIPLNTVPSDNDYMEIMQRPKVMVDPTHSTGGVMKLPFFWPNDWLSIPDSQWDQLGTLCFNDLNELAHANGETSPITITVFAWAEDVELYLPTSYVSTADVKDEYAEETKSGGGLVSKTLSNVAKASDVLSSVPSLGSLAMATGLAARTGASVAKHFGYSRVPIVEPLHRVRSLYGGNICNTDQPEVLTKLSLDTKQEVTIDPSAVGMGFDDELPILSLCQREGYVDTYRWSSTDPAGVLLLNGYVTPGYSFGASGKWNFTPMGYFSMPFLYWRGSIKFRFEVVGSTFHRGRLRVSWDPLRDNVSSDFNSCYNVVIDISEERNFEIVVPWASERPYNENKTGLTNVMTGLGQLVRTEGTNGVISVSVLNELVSMNSSGDNNLYINVYVSAGDDFQLQRLSDKHIEELSVFPDVTAVSTADTKIEESNGDTDPHSINPMMELDVTEIAPDCDSDINKVVFGETLMSFRSLMRRYELHEILPLDSGALNDITVDTFTMPSFPQYRGYDPEGVFTVGTSSYNYCRNHLMHWLTPCFLARRGSIRHKFVNPNKNVNGGRAAILSVGLTQDQSVTRDNFHHGHAFADEDGVSNFATVWMMKGMSGTAYTIPHDQPVVELEVPYYVPGRFISARRTNINNYSGSSHSLCDPGIEVKHCTTDDEHKCPLLHFVATGEDFSLSFYFTTPRMYAYSNPAP
jgi:hypothetical protein